MGTAGGRLSRLVLSSSLIVVWVVALVVGVDASMRYEATPGASSLPKGEVEVDKRKEWSCVIVAHPNCPCTKVSLLALRDVAAKSPNIMSVQVVFVGRRPEEASPSMRIAAQIGCATVKWLDPKVAAERYGARTSGQVLVYRRSGELVFHGGITPGRGVDKPRFAHELFDSIFAGRPIVDTYPVFGCPLKEDKP